jgi:hypothetical protein
MDLLSAFTQDQLNSLLQGGLDEIECEDQFAILNAKFQKLQLA